MAIKDLIRWNNRAPLKQEEETTHPIERIHKEIDRVFDEFFGDFRLPSIFGKEWGDRNTFSPRVNISEDDKNVEVTAELPGLSNKDIEVSLKDNVLTIKGEKNTEKEEKKKDYYHVERSYGTFQRSLKLPSEVDESAVDASFKDGILNIRLPKTEKAREKGRMIEVK